MENSKVEIGLPDKMEMRYEGSYFELVSKWFGWQTVVNTIGVAVWGYFVFTDFINIRDFTNIDRIEFTPFFFFQLIFVVVGIGASYYALAGWFNRTHILVSHGEIVVRIRPLPFFGNKTLSAPDIKQLYAKEKISSSGEGGRRVTYEVHAITHSERNVKLVRGLNSREQALYIEQEIEKYLGIQDAPVRGELEYRRKVPIEPVKPGKPCPTCGNSNIRRAYIEDGGMGDWCPDCKMSLQKMQGLI
jgi:hypothetical protein